MTAAAAAPVVRVQVTPFDAGAEMMAVGEGDSAVGGVASFLGRVRDLGDGPALQALELEHYPGMTERELTRIAEEAMTRFRLQACRVIHRVGRLTPGEPIVLVVTAAAHRQAAFEGCQFLMDWLKTRAPFWKREITAEGSTWVAARSSDDHAAARWQET